jgi:hypothetical protein
VFSDELSMFSFLIFNSPSIISCLIFCSSCNVVAHKYLKQFDSTRTTLCQLLLNNFSVHHFQVNLMQLPPENISQWNQFGLCLCFSSVFFLLLSFLLVNTESVVRVLLSNSRNFFLDSQIFSPSAFRFVFVVR